MPITLKNNEIERNVKNALKSRGFEGVLPLSKAREIVAEIAPYLEHPIYNISVELAPIHSVGGIMECNCKASKVIITKRTTKACKA